MVFTPLQGEDNTILFFPLSRLDKNESSKWSAGTKHVQCSLFAIWAIGFFIFSLTLSNHFFSILCSSFLFSSFLLPSLSLLLVSPAVTCPNHLNLPALIKLFILAFLYRFMTSLLVLRLYTLFVVFLRKLPPKTFFLKSAIDFLPFV